MVLPALVFWKPEIPQGCLPQTEAKEGSSSNGTFQHLQKCSDPHVTDGKAEVHQGRGIHPGWCLELEGEP